MAVVGHDGDGGHLAQLRVTPEQREQAIEQWQVVGLPSALVRRHGRHGDDQGLSRPKAAFESLEDR